MAELSTIARPYAQGLHKALTDRKAGAEDVALVLSELDRVAAVAQEPELATMVGDPKLLDDQLFDLVANTQGSITSPEVQELVRVVIENDRLEALPEIAKQFRELKNTSEGMADAIVETAFELSDAELESLMKTVATKFPGLTLKPVVTLNKSLIGGVTVRVGDQLLDGSIRSRLAQMKTMLTA